jgi:hypothetical protein
VSEAALDSAVVPGVAVELRRRGGGFLLGATGDSGRAVFRGLPAEELQLLFPALDNSAWSLLRKEPADVIEPAPDAVWSPGAGPKAPPGFKHPVTGGECLAQLADRFGFTLDALWNDPANESLRKSRPGGEPIPGDLLWVPARGTKAHPVQGGETHVFRRNGLPEILRVRFVDAAGKARAGAAYLMRVTTSPLSPQEDRTGKTDGEGFLVEPLPLFATEAEVQLRAASGLETHLLHVGRLEPVETVRGVQSRLRNLRYPCGDDDGEVGPMTRMALQTFQIDQGLEVNGSVDEPTRARLREVHRS